MLLGADSLAVRQLTVYQVMHIIDTVSSDAYHHIRPCILTEEGNEECYGMIVGLVRGV